MWLLDGCRNTSEWGEKEEEEKRGEGERKSRKESIRGHRNLSNKLGKKRKENSKRTRIYIPMKSEYYVHICNLYVNTYIPCKPTAYIFK